MMHVKDVRKGFLNVGIDNVFVLIQRFCPTLIAPKIVLEFVQKKIGNHLTIVSMQQLFFQDHLI